MKKALKWIGIVIIILIAFILIGTTGIITYDQGVRRPLPRTGVSQGRIPDGVDNTPVAIENVTVLPMDSERVLDGQTVVIDAGRIVEIGSNVEVNIPVGAHVVDATGKFLIPGLSDMHAHTFGVENDLLLYLANGVTTIKTVGGAPPTILKWRDEINGGSRVGPRIWVFWPSIEDTVSQYAGSESNEEFSTRGGVRFVHTPEEAEQLVAEMAALGVDGIKAHYIISVEIYQALLDSAIKHGLPLDGHMPVHFTECSDRQQCWDDSRAMGSPAYAHVEELIKVVVRSEAGIQAAAQDVADDGTWITTTLYLMRSISEQGNDLEAALAALPEVKYVHPFVYEDMGWSPESNYYSNVGKGAWFPSYLADQEKMLLALNDSDALLLSGTDTSLALLVPGFSLQSELEALADVGLSPYDVLKTSTYNPALYLGELDEFGTIEVGKRADLVLLDANPFEDITNTQQIAGVMVRGRYFDRADLDTILETVAKNYENMRFFETIAKIAFPVVVILLLVAVVWFLVRRRKAK